MPMGWWKPYFFFDPHGVQLLLPSFVLGTASSYIGAAVSIVLLCLADRRLAHALSAAAAGSESANARAALFLVQRCTGTLLMLLLMSFNAPIIAYTLASLGAAERYELWRLASRSSQGVWRERL